MTVHDVTIAKVQQLPEALAQVAKLRRVNPNWSLEVLRQSAPYKNPADLERQLDGLRKAGLK